MEAFSEWEWGEFLAQLEEMTFNPNTGLSNYQADCVNALAGIRAPEAWVEAAQKLKQAVSERNHANMMRYALAMDKAEVGA